MLFRGRGRRCATLASGVTYGDLLEREPGQASASRPAPTPAPGARVVHVHRIAGIGGSERHLLTLLPALAARGLDVHMLGLDVPGAAAERFYAELPPEVARTRLRSRGDVDPLAAIAAVRAGRRLRPSVVHTHLAHGDLYGALAAASCGAALVSSKHNDDPFRRGPFRHADRLLAARADRIIAISAALHRFSVREGGLPEDRLRVVPYGLDAPPEAPPPAVVPGDGPVLLAIGRLVRQKGHDVAVRALPAIRSAHAGAVLVVLGDGPLRAELTGLAAALDVADALLLPGRADDVRPWLARADLLVHPSRWEGFGLVLLEAMLAGLPVVASRVSAVPEVVVDGRTGVLVPADDPAALAGGVLRVLADPATAGAFGAAGRERARGRFSVDAMADRTLAVYGEALARRARGRRR